MWLLVYISLISGLELICQPVLIGRRWALSRRLALPYMLQQCRPAFEIREE